MTTGQKIQLAIFIIILVAIVLLEALPHLKP